jgi:hypothetical protein
MRKANLAWRPVPMKLRHCALGISALALAALLLPACQSTGAAGSGIIMVGESGDNKPVSPEEIDAISGLDRPYFLQVGDVVNIDFKVKTLRAGETPWDYKIEVGDSMEARLMPGTPEPGDYKLEVGDVIGISFLDNWQMNVTRTIRVDGMISAPEDWRREGPRPHLPRAARLPGGGVQEVPRSSKASRASRSTLTS